MGVFAGHVCAHFCSYILRFKLPWVSATLAPAVTWLQLRRGPI